MCYKQARLICSLVSCLTGIDREYKFIIVKKRNAKILRKLKRKQENVTMIKFSKAMKLPCRIYET